MRSSGHLKSNLISFWEMNKIANVRITVNPRAQRSRGRHDPRSQLLSQKACWAFLAAQSDVGMGKKSACVCRRQRSQHSLQSVPRSHHGTRLCDNRGYQLTRQGIPSDPGRQNPPRGSKSPSEDPTPPPRSQANSQAELLGL